MLNYKTSEIKKWIEYYTNNPKKLRLKVDKTYNWLKNNFNYKSLLPV